MVDDTGVLHHIKTVGLVHSFIVKVSLPYVTNEASCYPSGGFFFRNHLFCCNVCVVFQRNANLDGYVLDKNDSFLLNIPFFGISSFDVNLVNDLINNVLHILGLKLLTVVNTNLHASRLGHSDQHSKDEKCEDSDFDD